MRHKISIITGNSCNSNCVFCMGKTGSNPYSLPFQNILAEIHAARGKFQEIEFSGGEFLVRRDALTLIMVCRKAGFKGVAFGTNGKLLANPDFARAVVNAGADNINFSLHGFKPETHDALTGCPGSHALLMKGIDNVVKAKAKQARVIFVITKQNYREMPAVAALFAGKKTIDNVAFTLVRPMEYFTPEQSRAIVPRVSEIVPFLRAASAFSKTEIRYVPPCIFEKGSRRSAGTKHAIYGIPRVKSPYLFNYLSDNMGFGKSCAYCRKAADCSGIWKTYLSLYGDAELRPFS